MFLEITLKELDQIQHVCKQHSADYYMLTIEAIDKLGIKFDGSTVKAYTPPTYQDIRSFIRCILPNGNRTTGNHIAR